MDEINNDLLHACRYGKAESVKNIIKRNPWTSANKDRRGNTALHIACENGMPVDGIQCLYSAYPEALTMYNDEGASPFHILCFHGKSVENLKFLQGICPLGLVTTNENGDLPMHWISEDTSEELVKYLLEQFRGISMVKNKEGALPIHVACNKGLSLNVIRLLYEAYPDGILQPDKEGMLPIHDACEGVPNLELVNFFYEAAPASFNKADNKGNFALHCAVCSSPEVIQYVIKANELALQKPNSSGYLPIHKACSLGVEASIVKMLCESYPEGIKVKTSKGFFPFHLALTSLPTLAYLHQLFDKAIETPDKRGRFPIHVACEKGAPLDVITFLAEKCPIAAQKPDRSQMLPLHHAIVNELPSPAIKFLVDFYPEALHCVDSNCLLPFHLMFLHCNDSEVFKFLRSNYLKEFHELMVHPMKNEFNFAPLTRKGQKQAPSNKRKQVSSQCKIKEHSSSSREANDDVLKSFDSNDANIHVPIKKSKGDDNASNENDNHVCDNDAAMSLQSSESEHCASSLSSSPASATTKPSNDKALPSNCADATLNKKGQREGPIHRDNNNDDYDSKTTIDTEDNISNCDDGDTNSFEQPKEVTSIKKQTQDSNPNSSINLEQVSNETVAATIPNATNPNKTASKKYILTRYKVRQARGKPSWPAYFKYDCFRHLGSFKTRAMAESALEILRTRLSEESYDDVESIDNLVKCIRQTLGTKVGRPRKRDIVEKDNDKQQNEKLYSGRTKGSPKVSSLRLDHKIQHSLDSIGKRTRLSLTPIGKRT